MASWHIIKGPHLLFTGTNGQKTAGITLESEIVDPARSKSWDLNAFTLRKHQAEIREKLDLDQETYQQLLSDLAKLEA